MDEDTKTLLTSTCMALGGFEDMSLDENDTRQHYVMGDECLECLKDIKKFIKYYEEPGEDNIVLSFLGKLGILEKDLIPIILINTPANTPGKERLVLACVELMVPMTWIIDYKALQELVTKEEDESIVGNLHARLQLLREYKRAFLQPGVLGAVIAVLLKPLEVEHRMRTTRDQAIVRLGLTLFRNLVAIQDAENTVSGTMDQFISSIMQEELIERYRDERVIALLISLASSAMESQYSEWNSITMETLYYIFAGVDPEELIPSVNGGAKNTQLQELLNKEAREKKSQSSAGRKRHDRFGTTGEVRLQDGTRMVLHQKGALFASFEEQLDTVKKSRAKLKRHKRLNLEYVEKQYHEQKKNAHPSQLPQVEENYQQGVLQSDFDLVGASLELTSVFQVIMYMRDKLDLKEWDELKQAMKCIQEMLATLHIMSKSSNEDYRDFSAYIQNNLYYEEATLDLFLDLVKTYRRQPTSYLHVLLSMTHVLMKTLESYSKSKSYMGVKKKRAVIQRKKKKNKDGVNPDEAPTSQGVAGSAEEPLEAEPTSSAIEGEEATGEQSEGEKPGQNDEENQPKFTFKEHQFMFKDLEHRFATEGVINTYCAFLDDFAELDETQFHWVAAMLHRIAVNCKNMAVFYKLSTLQLFHQILQSGREDAKRDMIPLIYYVIHQFFKKLQEYPPLIAEVFFPMTSKSCRDINIGREAEELELQAQLEKKEEKLRNVELSVDKSLPETEQIRIAVMSLIDKDESELVEWVIKVLKDAVIKRHLMTFRSENELMDDPDLMFSVMNVEDIAVVPNTPAIQRSINTEPRLRLLLKLIKFAKEEVNNEIHYKISKDTPTDTLAEYQDLIESVAQNSADFVGTLDFDELIRKVHGKRKKQSPEDAEDRSDGGQSHRIRAPKEIPVYHSAEYVIDSDDDEERSNVGVDTYFEAEEQLRSRIRARFSEAERKHQEMIETQEREKKSISQKLAKRKLDQQWMTQSSGKEDNEGHESSDNEDNATKSSSRTSQRPSGAFISLSDSEDDSDNSNESMDDLDDSDSRPMNPKSRSDVEDESGESDQDSGANAALPILGQLLKRSQPRPTRLSSDVENDSASDTVHSLMHRQRDSEAQKVIFNQDEESDTEVSPVPESQRVNNKRRIVFDASEDEDEDRSQDSDRPARKKPIIDEDE
ncbi:Topoisomerase 1-associated factor 1 [Lunasporangiospora selenospora]|uniref:Topoisomerase 1-associated factor 1 n=1 Tax=Lunasporangiospora selenospora TaxID=979761 RepID=A0A9P6G2C9_9FUNG|nr:Topoisomerase 1-associated factor 1 [Lunasporangiospora selenospora]